jgi:hypothetical protein
MCNVLLLQQSRFLMLMIIHCDGLRAAYIDIANSNTTHDCGIETICLEAIGKGKKEVVSKSLDVMELRAGVRSLAAVQLNFVGAALAARSPRVRGPLPAPRTNAE